MATYKLQVNPVAVYGVRNIRTVGALQSKQYHFVLSAFKLSFSFSNFVGSLLPHPNHFFKDPYLDCYQKVASVGVANYFLRRTARNTRSPACGIPVLVSFRNLLTRQLFFLESFFLSNRCNPSSYQRPTNYTNWASTCTQLRLRLSTSMNTIFQRRQWNGHYIASGSTLQRQGKRKASRSKAFINNPTKHLISTSKVTQTTLNSSEAFGVTRCLKCAAKKSNCVFILQNKHAYYITTEEKAWVLVTFFMPFLLLRSNFKHRHCFRHCQLFIWPELLEARLALASVMYHRNAYVSMLTNG